ncbi:MAG: rhomboid family intramembrane serine protease [Promethearchaeota archaeon]
MVKCYFCDKDVYLPFKCRYCGKNFCQHHRIPENHECSFEFKDLPFLVKNLHPRRQIPPIYDDYPQDQKPNRPIQDKIENGWGNNPPTQSRWMSPFGMAPKLHATYTIMILNLFFYIILLILGIVEYTNGFNENSLKQFLTLSVEDYTLNNLRFYTIITALFIPSDIISLLFNMLILYSVGRLIEGRFGWKLFLEIYFISGLITGGMVIVFQLLFNTFPIYEGIFSYGFTTMSGAIMGLMAFLVLLLPRGEIFLFFFRIKTSNIIWLFLGFYLLIGVITQIIYTTQITQYQEEVFFPSFILYYASIFGFFGGYLKIRELIQP